MLTEENIKTVMEGFAEDLKNADSAPLAKSLVRSLVEKITFDSSTLEACIHYRVAVDAEGISVAFPRGFEPRFYP